MPEATVAALARVPLFAALEPGELEALAEQLGVHRFEAGATILRQGERGPRVLAFFVVAEGTAVVEVDGAEAAVLRPGDYFGEISLIRDVPRTATVRANDDLRCYAMSAWDFGAFVQARPEIAWKLCQTLAERVAENEARGRALQA